MFVEYVAMCIFVQLIQSCNFQYLILGWSTPVLAIGPSINLRSIYKLSILHVHCPEIKDRAFAIGQVGT